MWVVEKERTIFWFWNWVPLKIVKVMEDGTETTYTAEKIEENPDIAENRFSIPPGINFIEEDIDNIFLIKLPLNHYLALSTN